MPPFHKSSSEKLKTMVLVLVLGVGWIFSFISLLVICIKEIDGD